MPMKRRVAAGRTGALCEGRIGYLTVPLLELHPAGVLREVLERETDRIFIRKEI